MFPFVSMGVGVFILYLILFPNGEAYTRLEAFLNTFGYPLPQKTRPDEANPANDGSTQAPSGSGSSILDNIGNVLPLPAIKDALTAPSGWPIVGAINSAFGLRIFNGQQDFHQGIDINGTTGEHVSSTLGGKVLSAGWNGDYGNAVVVEGANGVEVIYGHLSSIAVKAGDLITKGAYIGNVGSTGRSTGPHLHYEVRVNGKAVDPWPYMN